MTWNKGKSDMSKEVESLPNIRVILGQIKRIMSLLRLLNFRPFYVVIVWDWDFTIFHKLAVFGKVGPSQCFAKFDHLDADCKANSGIILKSGTDPPMKWNFIGEWSVLNKWNVPCLEKWMFAANKWLIPKQIFDREKQNNDRSNCKLWWNINTLKVEHDWHSEMLKKFFRIRHGPRTLEGGQKPTPQWKTNVSAVSHGP